MTEAVDTGLIDEAAGESPRQGGRPGRAGTWRSKTHSAL